MIYVCTYSKIAPGEPTGVINDLLENAAETVAAAEKQFNGMILTREYFRKELWEFDLHGRRRLVKEERYAT